MSGESLLLKGISCVLVSPDRPPIESIITVRLYQETIIFLLKRMDAHLQTIHVCFLLLVHCYGPQSNTPTFKFQNWGFYQVRAKCVLAGMQSESSSSSRTFG